MSVITLGGRDFPVAPLTLGQMRRAGPAFVRVGFDTPEAMGAQVTLLLLAMQAADPTVMPDAVDNISGVTIPELRAALKVVLALIGVELMDAPPASPADETVARNAPAGEAQPAGEPPASTGPTSTAA